MSSKESIVLDEATVRAMIPPVFANLITRATGVRVWERTKLVVINQLEVDGAELDELNECLSELARQVHPYRLCVRSVVFDGQATSCKDGGLSPVSCLRDLIAAMVLDAEVSASVTVEGEPGRYRIKVTPTTADDAVAIIPIVDEVVTAHSDVDVVVVPK